MSDNMVVPVIKAMVNMASSMVGSTMAEIIISLLLPMPPKALPVSSAARVMKKRTMASR